jgi:nucleotide-binding universal stress UspA family protein
MFEKVLWATDGSAAADRALPLAKELAGGERALVVVHCNELMIGGRSGGYPVFADEEELQAKIRGQVAEAKGEGLKATLKIVSTGSASPAHVIADVAKESETDVIVVGTRGHSAVVGLLLGSVTQRLLHIAPCPVLVVPPLAEPVEPAAELVTREEAPVGL